MGERGGYGWFCVISLLRDQDEDEGVAARVFLVQEDGLCLVPIKKVTAESLVFSLSAGMKEIEEGAAALLVAWRR